ncbi:MAG: universal stress protein [Acidobacteria bacterium]|nr:universal stress protein [Acidobacteriota bacterium]
MIPFRRILFPVDFSAACLSVVPHVREMVRLDDAELTLIHVADPSLLIFGADGTAALKDVPPWEELMAQEQVRLESFARNHFPDLTPQLVLKQGDPGTMIAREVAETGTDLLMLPTRGYGLFRRLLIGSVAAKLLHDVSCAVWTGVHGLEPDQPRPAVRSMVCAVNFDDEAETVVRAAGALAKASSARLTLVHVVELPPMSLEIDVAPFRKSLLDAADLSLRKLAADAGLEADVRAVEGPVAQAISAVAVKVEADLLILGRGGSQGILSQWWSHIYPVIAAAPCPVLSI